jgi:hypothetical protein
LHIGAELADFNHLQAFPTGLNEPLEIRRTFIGRSGLREAGAGTFAGIGGQCELRDKQQAKPIVEQTAIHAAFSVREDPITQYSVGKPLNVGGFVIPVDGDENEQAAADTADELPIHGDRSARNALQESDHS